jgi:hypothetical protein
MDRKRVWAVVWCFVLAGVSAVALREQEGGPVTPGRPTTTVPTPAPPVSPEPEVLPAPPVVLKQVGGVEVRFR